MLRDVLYALALGFAIGALTIPLPASTAAAPTTPTTPRSDVPWARLLPPR